MSEIVNSQCFDATERDRLVSIWHKTAINGQLYLMAEIIQKSLDIDPESKDAERLAPVVGKHLSGLGMINKRMRGPEGNRRYWVKA